MHEKIELKKERYTTQKSMSLDSYSKLPMYDCGFVTHGSHINGANVGQSLS